MDRSLALLDPECSPGFSPTDQTESYPDCPAHDFARSRRVVNPRDVMAFPVAFRMLALELTVSALSRRIEQLETSRTVIVPITTLEPEQFDLIRDIPAVVSPEDDGYLATFFDANIGMTGDTREEAVENLRLLLVDMFDDLEAQESHLGPYPERQLAVLRAFIRRRP